MGGYSVPEHIRACKPKGTMVKAIAGNYYVYEYRSVKDGGGKRRTKMGKCIGSIKEGIGFVANGRRSSQGEVTTLEFGDWAVAMRNSLDVLGLLKECFDALDATRIYLVALTHLTQGLTRMRDVGKLYEMSCMSLAFPGLKMGPDAVGSLYDVLGRRQGGVMAFEALLASRCSRVTAIDGHVVGSASACNDLAEKGYRSAMLHEGQVNVLMAYDVNDGTPLLSRAFEGGNLDKLSVKDVLAREELHDMLFILDSGFYSEENVRTLSSRNNSYVIPLHRRLKGCMDAVALAHVDGRFVYQRDRKASAVEYWASRDEPGRRIIAYRDLNMAALEQSNYLRYIEQGRKSYTEERFEKMKDLMGVIVLQTNLSEPADEVFKLYKRRWSIETFFNYLKNDIGYHSLYLKDYYKTQGLAFVMLVSALIHKRLKDATAQVKGKTMRECLLDARMIKLNKRDGAWSCANCKGAHQRLFEALNTPLSVEALHT